MKKIDNSINKKIYIIDDFMKYHDIEFIQNLYITILKRKVDKLSLSQRLEQLRTGNYSKIEILTSIRFSKEGRSVNIPILGIKKRYLLTLVYRIPIIGYFAKTFITLLFLPKLIRRINSFETHYFREKNEISKQRINKELQTTQKFQEIKLHFQEVELRSKNIQLRINEINRAKELLIKIDNRVTNAIDSNTDNPITLTSIKNETNKIMDALYISFEDKFRGSREAIKERQKYYLPLVQKILEHSNGFVIDVGSGRGEWLELLKENNILAKGIDLNKLMVEESITLGLDAIVQDAIGYLKEQTDESIMVITGFHIVEHLPFQTLISLLDESYRVLKRGGMVIFETPNPENIIVGSYTFYIDPTHLNPIPPITLEFLAKNRGFGEVQIHRLHPLKTPSYIEVENSKDINNLIFAATREQDYSIVGYKR